MFKASSLTIRHRKGGPSFRPWTRPGLSAFQKSALALLPFLLSFIHFSLFSSRLELVGHYSPIAYDCPHLTTTPNHRLLFPAFGLGTQLDITKTSTQVVPQDG